MDGDKKIKYESFMPSPGYMFTQTAMLFLNFGMGFSMPVWVIWFPTILYLIVILFVLLVLAIVLIGSWIGGG